MRKVVLVIAIASLVLVGWCFHRRIFQDDEKRIKEIIEQMRLAAEDKSADRIIEHFSKDYSDRDGNSKFTIYGIIRQSLSRVDEIRVEISNVDVTVTGDLAWASLDIVVEATRGGDIYYPFGSDREPENPSLTFKKTKTGDWRITKVENVRGSSGF